MKERQYIIMLDVEDREAPQESNEESAKAMQSFILEHLQELQMNIININVECK